jgi:hypothetical protein
MQRGLIWAGAPPSHRVLPAARRASRPEPRCARNTHHRRVDSQRTGSRPSRLGPPPPPAAEPSVAGHGPASRPLPPPPAVVRETGDRRRSGEPHPQALQTTATTWPTRPGALRTAISNWPTRPGALRTAISNWPTPSEALGRGCRSGPGASRALGSSGAALATRSEALGSRGPIVQGCPERSSGRWPIGPREAEARGAVGRRQTAVFRVTLEGLDLSYIFSLVDGARARVARFRNGVGPGTGHLCE